MSNDIRKLAFCAEQAFGGKEWKRQLEYVSFVSDRMVRYMLSGERAIPAPILVNIEQMAAVTPTWALLDLAVRTEADDDDAAAELVDRLTNLPRLPNVPPAVRAGIMAFARFASRHRGPWETAWANCESALSTWTAWRPQAGDLMGQTPALYAWATIQPAEAEHA